MRVDRINYQKLFPIGIYQNIRVGVEAEVESGDDPNESLNKLKSFVEAWFTENYHHVGESVVITQEVIPEVKVEKQTPKEKQVSNIASQIATVTDLKVLDSYRLIVRGNPDLQPIYDNKLKELNNGLQQSKV